MPKKPIIGRPAEPELPRLVVGVGASAGGLEAFRTFLSLMPADTGMAFVLVQHLDPNRPSLLVDLLSTATKMPLAHAEDGQRLAADHVYVIPPDATLTITEGNILRVAKPAPPREQRRPIDTFFVSLAEAQEDDAVCIVLSGSGSDGSLGLTAIKENGGLTLAQADFDSKAKLGMPASAAATGKVDDVLTVEEMPKRLMTYQRHLAALRQGMDADGAPAGAAENLAKICRIVRNVVGHDFSQYKDNTLTRRIQRRMQVLHVSTMDEYLQVLRKNPDEARRLFEEVLIGVTRFFRDPESFAALEAQAIPQIIAGKSGDDQVRVWVPACATGEEVYSIAILLKEQLAAKEDPPKLQIFATDIDEQAIAAARAGRYSLEQLAGVTAERRNRWFTRENNHWCPSKDIRDCCVFSIHGAIKDPPFSRLDLIACRNLLIYLKPPAQERLIGVFEYALRPGGVLFLGASEGLSRQSKAFSVIDKKHRIFLRRETATPAPHLTRAEPESPATALAAKPSLNPDDRLDLSARRAMEKHFPAYVVVNSRHEIVRFSGRVARYLGPSPGAASLDLFTLLQRPLRPAARAVLQKAAAGRRAAVQKGVALGVDGAVHRIDLVAEPVTGGDDAPFSVLAFLDRGPAPKASAEAGREGVEDLEQELAVTRERLQVTIDELEANNEEMKSANEELQSVNEELQSSNEELETSKEEMQSINEELQTVNAEINAKNEALLRLNSDLKNFLDSTEIATIFLDAQLRITNFTPAMTDLFHLRESDHHRPITEIASRFDQGDLAGDVGRVVRTLAPSEREIMTNADRVFLLRMRPYRRVDNVIDGVVLTFTDITDRKRLETERRLRSDLVQSSNDAIIGLDLSGAILSWNAAAEALYGYSSDAAIGKNVEFIIPARRRVGELDLRARIIRGEPVESFDTVGRRQDGSRVDLSTTLSPVRDESGAIAGASLITRDIGERVRARGRQEMLLQELNHRVKNTLATVQSIVAQTLAHDSDPEAFQTALVARLGALSRTHNLLAQGDWQGSPLRDIAIAETQPYADGNPGRCVITGPDLTLKPAASLAMGMAFHELATNSAKYGAFSAPEGSVSVEWAIDRDARRLSLEWRESGGPLVTRPSRCGLGSRLIERGLAYELQAEAKLSFEPAGVHFDMVVPLDSIEKPR